MSNKSSKDRKARRKMRLEESLKSEGVSVDVVGLIESEPTRTKPEIGQFLSKFVKEIRLLAQPPKVTVYPRFSYFASRIMIDFVGDAHILVAFKGKAFETSLWKGIEEIETTNSQMNAMRKFVCALSRYGFLGKFENQDSIDRMRGSEESSDDGSAEEEDRD